MTGTGKIAIFGAAGAIGQSLAPELERRGIPFRVVGRSQSRLEAAFGKYTNAEIFPADLTDLRSAGAAARGMNSIIYTVGLPYPSHQLHPAFIKTTLAAAGNVGVERLVLVSSVYAYGVPRTSRVAETHPREPEARKGQYRKAQEDAVSEAHGRAGLQTLIVRLPDFYGPHAELGLAEMIFSAAVAGKTANWLGPVNVAHEFVFVPDTGPVIAELTAREDCFGEAWNFGGPGAINVMDFITRIYRAVGRQPKYRTVGTGIVKVMGWFNALYRELPEMAYLQERPVILDDRKLEAKLGGVHKTPYDEGIKQTVEWLRVRTAHR